MKTAFALAALIATPALGVKTKIVSEDFFLALHPGAQVDCKPGVASNGDNYPTMTVLDLKLTPSDAWGNSRYFNTSYFSYSTPAFGDFCAKFAKILNMPASQEFAAPTHREVFENFGAVSAGNTTKCLKSLREEMTIYIDSVPFVGEASFDVGFVDLEKCELTGDNR